MVESMPEPERSIMEWLLDLLVEVQYNQHVNKMTTQNLSIVVGPNLFTPSATSTTPLAIIEHSQKVAAFVGKALNARVALWEQQGWAPAY